MTQPMSARSAQRYAKLAGVLFLLSLVAGSFGEFYAPATIIAARDAAATAHNIVVHPWIFRLGFATYLIEGICDVALAWAFYVLLKPVNRNLALLSAFFGLVSTATFAVTEIFYFAPSFILGGADYLKSFSPEQLDSLALLSLKTYTVGSGILMAFYGVAWILRGYLIYRSGYLPSALGALAVLAGLGFVAHNYMVVLAPGSASDLLLAPMFLAGLSLTGWLLVKGVDGLAWDSTVEGLQTS